MRRRRRCTGEVMDGPARTTRRCKNLVRLDQTKCYTHGGAPAAWRKRHSPWKPR